LKTTSEATPHIFSVSELNEHAKNLLEGQFRYCWLEAEISNLSQPSSGHLYLTLKDDRAQLRAALFRNRNRGLGFKPANGMQVLVRGQLTLYTVRGDYQMIIDEMQEAGLGALQRAFEQLKNSLQQEGLFADARKRAVPRQPTCIGIITSASGAALQDMLSILKRRSPLTRIIVYPAQVQGADAPLQLVYALQLANLRAECDVLVLARGGGSLEDLWAFNDRQLAYAIAASALPVVSAVGHQTDVTIADFVADLRAPTPSAAAELLSNDINDLLQILTNWQRRMASLIRKHLRDNQARLSSLQRRLKHPGRRLQEHGQRLDELETRLLRAIDQQLTTQRQQLSLQSAELFAHTPRHAIAQALRQVQELQRRLHRQSQAYLQHQRLRCQHLVSRLDSVSPLATLARGYAIVHNREGQVISEARQCHTGSQITARLHHGSLTATVVSVETDR
jgi:exodeoxyribonuclease VII large subunit